VIIEESIEAVEKARFQKYFVKPLWDSWGFASLPFWIKHKLGIRPCPFFPKALPSSLPSKLVVIEIDGLGWSLFSSPLQKKFFSFFEEKGYVCKIVSQYPATTAVHTTTLYTGKNVGEHGLLGWYSYIAKLQETIEPLPLLSLEGKECSFEDVFFKNTWYDDFLKNNITLKFYKESFLVETLLHEKMTFSKGDSYGYKNIEEGLVLLQKELQKEEKQYHDFYISTLDYIQHGTGACSQEAHEFLSSLFLLLEKYLFSCLPSHTEVWIISDHGLTNQNLQNIYYLEDYIKDSDMEKTKQGYWKFSGDTGKNLFLHVKEQELEKVSYSLKEKLKNKALILTKEELLTQNFFPSNIQKNFLENLGNLEVIAYPQETIWLKHIPHIEATLLASHGGLTLEEMETPFLILKQN